MYHYYICVYSFIQCFTFLFFFFFQAEDGIRDDLVTGVQTCALPIWSLSATPIAEFSKTHLHRSSLFRRASSARFRSSRSVFVPYHFATFPDRSRSGLPRKRNQRNSPSKRRKRPSISNGFTEFKASRDVSRIRGRASGSSETSHPTSKACL